METKTIPFKLNLAMMISRGEKEGIIHKEPAAIVVRRRMCYDGGRFVWKKSRRNERNNR